MAHFVDHVIEVISKPPAQRTDQDVAEILPWLRKRSNTVYHLTRAVLKNLIRNCHYRKSPPNDVIIKQGELGDCMYIILRGRISVYIDPSMTGEDEGFTPVPSSPKKHGGVGASTAETKRRRAGDRSSYGKFIIHFESGKSFGEVALMSEDNIRNASIITDNDCDFLVVDRELFNSSLKEYEERSYAECRHFVQKHPFFSKMSQRFKRLLTLSLRKEQYGFESTLVKQGEPITGLHFILRGQAKFFMEPTRHRHQYPNLWPFEAAIDIYSIEFDWLREPRKNAILRKYRDPNALPMKVDNVDLRRRQGYVAVERKLHERSVSLCGVQNGEVLGDTEICLGLGTYMQTVVCSTDTEVFILDMKNFERLVGRKNPNTIQMMKKLVESKLAIRKDLKYAQHIPLLKFLHYKLTEGSLPEAKRLPPLKESKVAPDINHERQYILDNFLEGKSPLVDPQVPGAVYYKNLMQEKARIRENIRKRGSSFNVQHKQKIRNPNRRQPRSRREIVESLQQMLDDDLLMFQQPRKKKPAGSNGSVRTDAVSETTVSRRTSFSEPSRSRATSFSRKKGKFGSTGSLNTDTDDKESVKSDGSSSQKRFNSKFVPKPPSEPNSGKSTPRRGLSPLSVSSEGKEKDQNMMHQLNEHSVKLTHGPIPPASSRGPQLTESNNVLPPIREDTAEQLLSRERKESAVSRKPNLESPKEIIELELERPKSAKGYEPLNIEPSKEKPEEEFHLPTLAYVPLSTRRSSTSSVRSRWEPARKIIQERIQDRISTQLADKEPSYADYDTSENSLSYLESRIRSFHLKYGNKNKMTLKLPKLRRYTGHIQETPESQPRPGGKVWIRKQLCQFADQRVQVKGHKHVRYHMVESLPQFDHVKKTRMIMNYLMSARNQTDTQSLGNSNQAISFTQES
ncbi:uncharacterized protein LOC124130870 [Haliotis rufescens]|uniref:uncharacterized protein LOC124130870 n=1 Tax=Haliotis rufescens TaxID=6454 RepID=UPI00201EFC39|nr:uncharacterized protein LOC124130870 [Haliotis rufescens]XP_046349864.2 uncharacterized protein LOC124130870 [Haliotis rufescens]XP_046349865.2 uncharacterized protein LOC124130870 [Haliotis rufescens]XP_048244410.1 uncharacterized protein LOC124130870 [Haliotis rufescens]XP_048244411.1 uncharacterized protein LOC124130870 [Haliotis rufescens]